MKEQQDYAQLLAWNFTPETIKHGTKFQKRGGRFIVPISGPNTVDFCQPNPVRTCFQAIQLRFKHCLCLRKRDVFLALMNRQPLS
jgi:hypothetical protein